jgi:hypothetical protein
MLVPRETSLKSLTLAWPRFTSTWYAMGWYPRFSCNSETDILADSQAECTGGARNWLASTVNRHGQAEKAVRRDQGEDVDAPEGFNGALGLQRGRRPRLDGGGYINIRLDGYTNWKAQQESSDGQVRASVHAHINSLCWRRCRTVSLLRLTRHR